MTSNKVVICFLMAMTGFYLKPLPNAFEIERHATDLDVQDHFRDFESSYPGLFSRKLDDSSFWDPEDKPVSEHPKD